MPAIFGIFVFMFIVVFIVSVTTAIFKFSKTRQMALEKGASENEATAVALSGDIGTAAAYVKKPAAPRPAAERVREVRDLQAQGLITEAQAEARVAEILRSI
jgi:competence protein ComGC